MADGDAAALERAEDPSFAFKVPDPQEQSLAGISELRPVSAHSLGTSLSDDVSDEEAKQQFNSDTEPSQGLGSQSSTAEADIALEQASVGGDSLHGDSQLVAPGDDPFAALDSNDGREPTRLRSSVDELVEELVKELRQQGTSMPASQDDADLPGLVQLSVLLHPPQHARRAAPRRASSALLAEQMLQDTGHSVRGRPQTAMPLSSHASGLASPMSAFGEHAHQEHAHRSAILTPPRSGNGSPHRLHSYDASPDHGHQSRSADGVDDDNIYIAALDSRLQQAGQRRLNNRVTGETDRIYANPSHNTSAGRQAGGQGWPPQQPSPPGMPPAGSYQGPYWGLVYPQMPANMAGPYAERNAAVPPQAWQHMQTVPAHFAPGGLGTPSTAAPAGNPGSAAAAAQPQPEWQPSQTYPPARPPAVPPHSPPRSPPEALPPGRPVSAPATPVREASAWQEQEVAALRKEVDMLKVHQRDAQLLIQRQQGTNEELEMQKADLAKRLRAAEANMQESEREGSTFRSRWMEASEGFERLQGLLKSRDAECEALRRKAAEDADQLKARADACEREHGRCLALENEVSRLRELCTELERALAAENKRAETIASEERKLDNLCLRLRKDNEMLADKASQADRFCGELRDQVQALTGELKAGERKMSYLNGENEVLRKDNAALNKHLAALDAECAQLRTSLHTAKDEVQDMKERYRQLERAALSFDYSPDKPRRSPPGGPAYPYRTSSIIPAGSFQSPPGVDLNAPSQYAQPSTARGMEDSFDLFTGAPARASGSPRSSYQPARLFPQQVDGGAGDPSGPEHWGSSWERAQESFPPAGQRKASNQPAEYPSRPTYAGDYGPQMAALPAPPPRYPNAHMPAPSSYHPDYPSNPGLSSQQADARFAAEDQHPAYAAEQARAAGYGDVRSAQARADTVGYPDSAPTTSRDSYGQSQPPSHPPPSRAANARSRTGANANRRSPITGVEPGEAMPGSREEQAARGVATDWTARPYGTQLFLDDMMAKTASLEERLMALNMERQQLEAEYARMPPTAGRTIRERNRKAEVEARLEEVAREASNIRLQLKKLGVK